MVDKLITFDILEFGIYQIQSKNLGLIGFLNWNDKNKKWVFLPEKHKFYTGLHLAIILHKLNELNDYKPKGRIA